MRTDGPLSNQSRFVAVANGGSVVTRQRQPTPRLGQCTRASLEREALSGCNAGPRVPGDTLHPENLLTQVQKVNRLPRVTEELQRKRKSHSLSGEGNPILGVARDNAQRVANEAKACSEKHGDSADTDRMVAKAYACIDTCDASILVAKARIDELARRD